MYKDFPVLFSIAIIYNNIFTEMKKIDCTNILFQNP